MTSLEFQPILENDLSLTSSAHGHSAVSTAFLAIEFPNGPLSDAISLTRDGLGLKPSLEFDERKKILVGSKEKIDIDYIKKNLYQIPLNLKKNMIKDADISVVIIIIIIIKPLFIKEGST